MPMINRDRFSLALNVSTTRPQLSALKYGVAMVGASVSEQYSDLEEKCYHLTRKYIEIAERQEDAANFVNLDALQACVLTIWYEFKGPGFARAWMNLGRAVRLAKMLGLHHMDRQNPVRVGSGLPVSGFQIPLPATEGPAEMEERRRTFWLLFIFEAYAWIRTGSAMTIHESEVSSISSSVHASI